MSYALENYETAIKCGDISHNGNKDLTRHLGNAYRHDLPQKDMETGKSLWLISKERRDSPNKIDLAMASVISWEARTDAIAAGAKSSKCPYNAGRGIITL
jgi:phage terminase large subunit-like protein